MNTKVGNLMPDYLNQIESDLYILHSIIDVAGDSVPEMVAELKEKYRKAEAFDRIKAAFYDSVMRSEFEIRVSEILRSMK